MRRGEAWEQLYRSFDLNAEAGADILSIESIGGKEVHDKALIVADIPGIALALGVLAPRDMTWLWDQIRKFCERHPGVVPGGELGVSAMLQKLSRWRTHCPTDLPPMSIRATLRGHGHSRNGWSAEWSASTSMIRLNSRRPSVAGSYPDWAESLALRV